jgi:DNA-binding NarL/FixJ family response regulator
MDISMPELDGFTATAKLAAACPEIKVIMLSVHTQEDCVLQAMQSGARGYLLKNTPPEELARALHAVAQGETYLCSAVSEHVVAALVGKDGTRPGGPKRPTPRQLEVLKLIAEGNSTKQIAKQLNISVKTAEHHRTHVMKLLNIHDTASLVRYAIRLGVASAAK